MDEDGQTLKEFMREMILRMERSERAHIAALDKLTSDSAARATAILTEVLEHRGEWRADAKRAREEMKVVHEALFRIFDRLDERGGGAAA